MAVTSYLEGMLQEELRVLLATSQWRPALLVCPHLERDIVQKPILVLVSSTLAAPSLT